MLRDLQEFCRNVAGFAEILPEFTIFAGFCDISEDWHDFACGDPNRKFPRPF